VAKTVTIQTSDDGLVWVDDASFETYSNNEPFYYTYKLHTDFVRFSYEYSYIVSGTVGGFKESDS
jgi:hypothetical protein